MQLTVNILAYAFLVSVIAASFSLIYRSTGHLHLGHAAMLIYGPYLFHLFTSSLGIPSLLALLCTLVGCAALGLAMERWLFRPMSGASGWLTLTASLGIYVVLVNVLSMAFGEGTHSLEIFPVAVGHKVLGAYVTTVQLISAATCLSVLVLLWSAERFSNWGKAYKAVAIDPVLSSVVGISVNRLRSSAYALGSAIAGLAGILIAADTDMTPGMGFRWLLYGVVAMTMAGAGKVHLHLVGALVLAAVQHGSAWFLGSEWMDAAAFIILVAVLVWKPRGFANVGLKKVAL